MEKWEQLEGGREEGREGGRERSEGGRERGKEGEGKRKEGREEGKEEWERLHTQSTKVCDLQDEVVDVTEDSSTECRRAWSHNKQT